MANTTQRRRSGLAAGLGVAFLAGAVSFGTMFSDRPATSSPGVPVTIAVVAAVLGAMAGASLVPRRGWMVGGLASWGALCWAVILVSIGSGAPGAWLLLSLPLTLAAGLLAARWGRRGESASR